tara:strand:- start:920 stop:1711 length:792 start_codon:yes stop_codon:yes gene_type:complete
MKFYSNQKLKQPMVQWKNNTNNIIVSKNVLNTPTTSNNNCKAWNNCSVKSPYKFNPNPIRHYRKQYVANNSFSKNSLIGHLDKPGNYIVTSKNDCVDCADNNVMNLHVNIYNTPNNCDKENNNCNIIKRATTVLNDEYSSSSKELLYKKCKTYNQNLSFNQSTKTVVNGTMTSSTCNSDTNKCLTTFNPSNQKYQVQGPVTSSTRIAALKYGCNKWINDKSVKNNVCLNSKTDYNNKQNLTSNDPLCVGCKDKPRRKRINVLG